MTCKHSAVQRLVLSLLVSIITSPPAASATVVNVAANLADIQGALSTVQQGDTIIVGSGEVDLGDTGLVLSIPGVTLQGAGPGQTIIKSNSSSLYTMLGVYTGSPLATTPPLVIEGFSFLNSALSEPLTAAAGPIFGIYIVSPGLPGNFSVVKNCEFLYFSQDPGGPVQLGLGSDYWSIEHNVFDGNFFGIANVTVNRTGLSIMSNTFSR